LKLRKEVEAVQTTNLRLPFGLIRLDKEKQTSAKKVKYPTQLKTSSSTSGSGRNMWKKLENGRLPLTGFPVAHDRTP
jgi:hypothetical protein